MTYSICLPLLLAGLFGLVFLLLLAAKGKGKKGKTSPTSSGGGGGLKSCATAGCHNRFSHHDNHELCFSCCGREHLLLFCEDCNHLSFANLQLRAIRLALWEANPSVLPPNVSSVEVGLDQLGELIGGRAYAQAWFANWTASYFNRHPVQPPGSHSTAGTPIVADQYAGDTSSSASPFNVVTEELEAGLGVSTGHVGTTDRTPSVATLPPATTPLVGLSQVQQALPLSLGRSPINKTALSRPVMGDGPNQPDLSRLGTQTSVPSTLHVRLSESPGGPLDDPSSVARPVPSPCFMPGLGRGPTSSIPQPSRFVGSGLGVGSLRAGRPVPSRFSHSAVLTSEFTPLTHQGEGTGLPALSSRGDRYGLPPPLRVLPPHLDSQSFAPPPPPVTTDMGTHAGVGYLGVAPQTVVPENPPPRRGFSLGYQPPENPRPCGILSLGRLPPRGGMASLSGLSRPLVT